MNTSASPSKNQPSSAQPAAAQPHAGAEYGEAGDPGQSPAESGRFSASLQARGGQGQVSGRSPRSSSEASTLPPVDIVEDEGGITLWADLPGVTREQLQVRVEGEVLLIEGRATVPETGQMSLVHGELLSPHYRRSFTLSRDLNPGRIEAELRHGVLRLRIPKAEQAKPRRIEVQVG